MRKQLISAFKSAGLYLGNEEQPIFPKIHSVIIDDRSTKLTFSLRTGMDPNLIKKKMYVFHQKFGKNTQIKGEIKTFQLTVYAAGIPSSLLYDYEKYVALFKGLSIPIVAGMDLNGNMVVFDLVKNPHLLIAGETGSGKSTQLRSILTTLIKTLPPERLQLYLCDLKHSEFHVFRQIEHVQGVFVTAKEMMPVFTLIQGEMKRRGDLLDHHELSHVDDLPDPPPYIVVCIDEVALLQKEKSLMELVEEVSAIGRALGVFLILSMQRPDSKVLDGKLKNNLTVRMGFKCADLINSRIVGTPGSEKLKEEGRFLIKLPAFSENKELQAPFLSLDMAKKLLMAHWSAKTKDRRKPPLNASSNVIDLKENENGIFEVLDE
ncbi:FtsK/SpoIIIE domain-containing protein [Bacillus canaveralius]|uniref:FtsK/SpoIIIE domain-containing protein n=1 Tax=Bacillus canaveralius TaxID=1403243 RepID=UPI0015E0CAC4|nr:FtsK/SpoIIIE domain-containing protein [Bacillus canaveralius]